MDDCGVGMARAVMSLNVAGLSSFAKDGGLSSPSSPASSGCDSPIFWCSSASHYGGQRIVTASSPREPTSCGPTPGARAYAATEENVRTRYVSGVVTKNLYDLLGVSKTASPREIKAAYRLAARRLHPDVVPEEQKLEATKAFLEIQETYSILADQQMRAAYDLSLSMQTFQSGGFINRGPISYSGVEEITYSTPSWGFTSSPISSNDSFSSRNFSFKGRNWETDQCW